LCVESKSRTTDIIYGEAAGVFNKPREVVVIVKCPKCGGEVTETPKAFSCGGGRGECKFVLWKSQFYKNNALTLTQAKKLLERGKTDLIKGFVSKSKGTKYDAFLVLKSDFSVGMEFK
jgi:DNA topoisomerase-3